jgi:HPt (histidine-containing phosphotransfer) domain-containing protein
MTQYRSSDEEDREVVKVDEDLEELVPRFLASKRRDVDSISQALRREDYEAVRIIAHKMTGSGGGYGFERISEIGRFLERAARERDPTEIKRWSDELAAYLRRVVVIYE